MQVWHVIDNRIHHIWLLLQLQEPSVVLRAMASYPPPPPYGPPFNTNSNIAPPVAAYNPGMPQHPYHQHGQAPYYYGQSQPNGQPPNPHMNSYSYHVNGQGTPPIPGHPVNPTSFVGYGNQVYHSAIPPPPYPPAQIQSGVPSYVPQPAPHFPTISNSASHPIPITPTAIHTQEVVKPQETNVESPNHSTPHASELEDGEVNDGEGDTLAQSPDADKMGSSFSRNPQGVRNDNAEPSTAVSGSSNLNGTQQEDHPIKQGICSHIFSCPNHKASTLIFFGCSISCRSC